MAADNQKKRHRRFIAESTYLRRTYSQTRAPTGLYPDLLVSHLTERYFGTTGRLLDLGCGRGDFLAAFARAGFDVIGVDIHKDAGGNADGASIIRVDLEGDPLPFMPGIFDFVFSKSLVEHLADAAPALADVRSVMRPGGKIVVMTPSWRHTYRDIFFSEYTHVRPFTRQSLGEALVLAGFDAVSVGYFRQLPFLWRSPWLSPAASVLAALRLPYRPLYVAPWPAWANRTIRFSREVMLLATGTA